MDFQEFWPRYLRAHNDPRTRAMHVAGTIAASSVIVTALALRKPWLIAVGLVAGYGPAWFSHAFIEHNKPETFRAPGLRVAAGRFSDGVARAARNDRRRIHPDGGIRMKAMLAACLTALLLAMTPHSQVILERDATAPVTIGVGEDFYIALASNASTGYTWSQTIGDGKILAYEGVLQQAAAKAMPGAPGQQIFIFHANRTGSSTILFAYARSWEHKAAAKTLSFTIEVR